MNTNSQKSVSKKSTTKKAVQKNTTEKKSPKTYFGEPGREYSLTSENYDRVLAAISEFADGGKWKWSNVDVLGVKKDGSVTKRFHKVLEAIKGQNQTKELFNILDQKIRPAAEKIQAKKRSEKKSEKK